MIEFWNSAIDEPAGVRGSHLPAGGLVTLFFFFVFVFVFVFVLYDRGRCQIHWPAGGLVTLFFFFVFVFVFEFVCVFVFVFVLYYMIKDDVKFTDLQVTW